MVAQAGEEAVGVAAVESLVSHMVDSVVQEKHFLELQASPHLPALLAGCIIPATFADQAWCIVKMPYA